MLSERALHHRAYWSHTCLALRPEVDAERLKDAWAALAKANDMLRTGFIQPADADVCVDHILCWGGGLTCSYPGRSTRCCTRRIPLIGARRKEWTAI